MGSEVKTMGELLVEYAVILNKHGANSPESQRFLEEHQDNKELIELAKFSQKLKRVLTATPKSQEPQEAPQP